MRSTRRSMSVVVKVEVHVQKVMKKMTNIVRTCKTTNSIFSSKKNRSQTKMRNNYLLKEIRRM